MEDLQGFHWRLAEVIAWCAGRDAAVDPRNSLRTLALRPPHLLQTPTELREAAIRQASTLEWLASLPDPKRAPTEQLAKNELEAARTRYARIHAERQAIVRTLAEERAERLRTEGRYPRGPAADLADGRLILMEFDFSVWDGVSELESEGFFDEEDVPPWDTWICCLADTKAYDEGVARYLRSFRRRAKTPPSWHTYLVCWVPPELIELAGRGIAINPVDAVVWAPDDGWTWMRRFHPG